MSSVLFVICDSSLCYVIPPTVDPPHQIFFPMLLLLQELGIDVTDLMLLHCMERWSCVVVVSSYHILLSLCSSLHFVDVPGTKCGMIALVISSLVLSGEANSCYVFGTASVLLGGKHVLRIFRLSTQRRSTPDFGCVQPYRPVDST